MVAGWYLFPGSAGAWHNLIDSSKVTKNEVRMGANKVPGKVWMGTVGGSSCGLLPKLSGEGRKAPKTKGRLALRFGPE